MTLDKIEYYMEEHVFTYWTKTFFEFTNGDYLKQKQILSKAIKNESILWKKELIK